ncbi:VOC family protein, partial [Pseudomonas aeruginosa]|nr:VOC family protein [Pseudomonas aeruginosa]
MSDHPARPSPHNGLRHHPLLVANREECARVYFDLLGMVVVK